MKTRTVFALAAVALLPAALRAEAPAAQAIVGTPACPKLNRHDGQACHFRRGGHEFQVWPDRIAVRATTDPARWLVETAGHRDGMFDHVLGGRKDDHVTFQCFVGGGRYYGPMGFRIQRGGAWATYGEGVTTAAAVAGGAVAAYFSGGTAGPAGSMAGGAAAQALGTTLSRRFGSRSWEAHAAGVAAAVCEALAR